MHFINSKALKLILLVFATLINLVGVRAYDLPVSQSHKIDKLYEDLRNAPNAIIAQQFESEIYMALTSANSEIINYQMNLAIVSQEKGDYQSALFAYDEILKRDPNFMEARNNKASILYILGDKQGAKINLERIIKQEPRHNNAWAALGSLEFEMGDIDAAKTAFQNALYHNAFNDTAKRGLFDIESKTKGMAM